MSYRNGLELNGMRHENPPLMDDGWQHSEVDHRVANSFTLLASTISNQARQLSKQQRMMNSEEVHSLLSEISARIAAVGQLHRDIAARPGELHIDLNAHLWKLSDALIETLAPSGQFELLPSATASCAIKATKALPISLIVTEIVTNALKYAHPTGVSGTVSVGCRRDADGSVLVEVTDDGIGLPEGFDPASSGGIGSRTVNALAKKLQAEVSFVSGPVGLCFTLRLPPSVAA